MLYLISFLKFACVTLAASERPEFRLDYRYEKAFDSFYKVHHSAATWAEARIRCQGEGAELMVPENLDEADAMPLLITGILKKFLGVYIGIHDLYSERSFVTLDGSAVMDTILSLLWDKREPKYIGGRCVAMNRNGRLFVHPCGVTLPYICKVHASKIVYHEECDTYNPDWKLGIDSASNSCYITHAEPQNWHDAFATCHSTGGHLVIPNNRREVEHIKRLFMRIKDNRVPDNDFAFLGFSDLLQKEHYRTIHGERIEDTGYSDWTSKCGQRNKTSQMRCGGMHRSGLLAVVDCNTPAIFFCEKPINPLPALRSRTYIEHRTKKNKSDRMKLKHRHIIHHANYFDLFLFHILTFLMFIHCLQLIIKIFNTR